MIELRKKKERGKLPTKPQPWQLRDPLLGSQPTSLETLFYITLFQRWKRVLNETSAKVSAWSLDQQSPPEALQLQKTKVKPQRSVSCSMQVLFNTSRREFALVRMLICFSAKLRSHIRVCSLSAPLNEPSDWKGLQSKYCLICNLIRIWGSCGGGRRCLSKSFLSKSFFRSLGMTWCYFWYSLCTHVNIFSRFQTFGTKSRPAC